MQFQKRDFDRAIRDYTEATRLEPDSKASYFNRGDMHMNKEQYDKAIEDYIDAIRGRR